MDISGLMGMTQAQRATLLALGASTVARWSRWPFSVDEARLTSVSFDGTVRLWDVSTVLDANAGDVVYLATLDPYACVVYALAFHPDGHPWVSGGAEGFITLWDLPAHQRVATLPGEEPYARMNITDVTGLTNAQRATLRLLGAVET
ncbi:MAG: hypothetical protein KJ077_37180 [Anaerolineae bacterium]|nr:hypothetical protein [Anaerolineae bacterium]